MLTILLTVADVIGISLQNVLKKGYDNRSSSPGVFYFGAVMSVSAMLVFLVSGIGTLRFLPEVLPYSIVFAVSYFAAMMGQFLALRYGPLSLTTLIASYSLLLPTLYGLIFLHDDISPLFFPGLALLILSLLLIYLKRNREKTNTSVSWKWIVFLIIGFVGNGMCSIVQKMQQISMEGQFKNELMIYALLLITVLMLLSGRILERGQFRTTLREGWKFAVPCGLCNGIVNLLTMVLAGMMAASVEFPILSAGSLLVTFLFSVCLYREKLSLRQWIGAATGVASIILLSV